MLSTSLLIKKMDQLANVRNKWIKKNQYYYDDLSSFYSYHIYSSSKVLEIGCGTGYLLNAINPKYGLGIDISPKMIQKAKKKYKKLNFKIADAHDLKIKEKFDFIILSDTTGYLQDIPKVFSQLHKVSNSETRIIINFENVFWTPLFAIAEKLGLKMPSSKQNWLNISDLENLLALTDFEVIKTGRRFLLPIEIPYFSEVCNKYLAQLPLINNLCLNSYLIARPKPKINKKRKSASIIVPARNEAGNIKNVLKRLPIFAPKMELIFIEGHSTDNTLQEIKKICQRKRKKIKLKFAKQDGKGKADAVRKGFNLARNEILMILDADLTTPPEELPQFYRAINSGHGEFINGSRLVYPLEKEAMRFLNILGNHFFSRAFSWLLGQRLKDTLCGTKVLSRKNWQKIIANRSYFGDFDPFGDFDLIFGANKLNLKIVEIPVHYKAREYGETNISRFRHGLLLLQMVFFAMGKIKLI